MKDRKVFWQGCGEDDEGSWLSDGSGEERGHSGQLRVREANLPSEHGQMLQSTHPAKVGGWFAASHGKESRMMTSRAKLMSLLMRAGLLEHELCG